MKEGATNGNKFVLKKIQTTLGLPEAHAVGYMDPHGMSQRKRWNQFKRDLNALALTEEEQQRCLEVARQSFQMFMDISSSVSNHFDQEHATQDSLDLQFTLTKTPYSFGSSPRLHT